jgi:CheY-like chemotaxis protein
MSVERTLVVDDDPLNVRIIRSLLQREGYEVQTASDGRQALAASATFKPQLVLADIQLPLVDGRDLTRRRCGHRIDRLRNEKRRETCT